MFLSINSRRYLPQINAILSTYMQFTLIISSLLRTCRVVSHTWRNTQLVSTALRLALFICPTWQCIVLNTGSYTCMATVYIKFTWFNYESSRPNNSFHFGSEVWSLTRIPNNWACLINEFYFQSSFWVKFFTDSISCINKRLERIVRTCCLLLLRLRRIRYWI